MKRLFIFLSALFALFLLQVAPAQAISLGSKTASAKGPDTLLIIQLDPNYVGKRVCQEFCVNRFNKQHRIAA